jgi:hypothetical protein
MDYPMLAVWALAMVLALAVLVLVERWWLRWSIRRHLARLPRDGGQEMDDPPRLIPESLYVVLLPDSGVCCTHPDGTTESVAWSDLQRVEIVSTDHGPFLPDVFWVLHGSSGGCVVPQGGSGETELLERLQQLPGFRNEAMIAAMPSTEHQRF